MMEGRPHAPEATWGRPDGRFGRQWRQVQEAYHGVGPQAKRSPRERSAAPGRSDNPLSQVALNCQADVTRTVQALSGGPAPANRQDRGGYRDQPRQIAGAGRPMPITTALTSQQARGFRIERREQAMSERMKAPKRDDRRIPGPRHPIHSGLE